MASIDESPAPDNDEIVVSEPKKNGIASALTFIGIMIFIIGFLIGLIYITFGNGEDRASFWILLLYWSGAFVTGMLFLGFAEIIKLLQKISDK